LGQQKGDPGTSFSIAFSAGVWTTAIVGKKEFDGPAEPTIFNDTA
jgi:hypothetical protein